MKKDWSNFTLAISLIFIISISIYFFVQWIRSENINHYLDFLGTKLLAMVPQDKKKAEVSQLYDQFRQQVDEKKVTPEKVEKVAVEILNLKNSEDSLSLYRVEKAMQMALNKPQAVNPEILKYAGAESENKDTPPPIPEQKWRELRDRLKNVYVFEENLKRHQQEKELLTRQYFQYDSNLQVIVDGRLRQELLHGVDQVVIETLKELEKQKWLVWEDNYDQNLKQKLDLLNDSLQTLQLKINKIPIPHSFKVVIPGADSLKIHIKFSGDSAVTPILPHPDK